MLMWIFWQIQGQDRHSLTIYIHIFIAQTFEEGTMLCCTKTLKSLLGCTVKRGNNRLGVKSFSIDCVCSMYMYFVCLCAHAFAQRLTGSCSSVRDGGSLSEMVVCTNLALSVLVTVSESVQHISCRWIVRLLSTVKLNSSDGGLFLTKSSRKTKSTLVYCD